MENFEAELWGNAVTVEYEVIGHRRPERPHDYGWDPPETTEVRLYRVLISHPTKKVTVDVLPVLDDSERNRLEIEIERYEDGV